MFANFFGIVIVSASILMIAGLILRPTPDLPASMNLGIVKTTSDATQQTSTVDATATTTSTSSEGSSSSTTATNAASTETTTTDTSVETTAAETSGASKEATTETTETSKTPEMSELEKRNMEIRRRAAEESASGTVRVNKSDR